MDANHTAFHDIENHRFQRDPAQVYAPKRKENVVDDRFPFHREQPENTGRFCFIRDSKATASPAGKPSIDCRICPTQICAGRDAKIQMSIERGVVFHDASPADEDEDGG